MVIVPRDVEELLHILSIIYKMHCMQSIDM